MNIVNSCQRRIINIRCFCLTFVCLLWMGALGLRATDYYVATNGAGGDFLSWGTAASNIQDAVNVACGSVDHTVWVSNGTYRLTNQIEITNRITVRGLNGYSNTFVYADWPSWTTRCFYVTQTGVVDGFTISNGHYWASNNNNGGAGAYLGTGTIQNCCFVRNVCSNTGTKAGGGGVYIIGYATISNCIFFTNVVYTLEADPPSKGGGAIFFSSGNGGNILSCLIVSNCARGRGGAIGNFGASVTPLISNCTISYNYSSDNGVALYGSTYCTDCIISNNTGNRIIESASMNNCVIANNYANYYDIIFGASGSNCTISGNRACAGSVVCARYGSIWLQSTFSNNICSNTFGGAPILVTNNGIIRNCLIHHNTNMSTNGGSVLLGNAAIDRSTYGLVNCTIVNNYSTNEGGGIATLGPSNFVVNCIIASNNSSSGNYPNVYYRDNVDANKSNFYYSCAITTDAYLFAANQGNMTNDPLFAGAGAGNWRLGANSPCINRGTNQNWMTNGIDLDGKTRIRYGVVDMGAYERINEGTIYGFQ